MEELARLAKGRVTTIKSLARPFSNFCFLAKHKRLWLAGPSLRRIFSEARRSEAGFLAVEEIEKSGETEDETKQLADLFPDYHASTLTRITFWSSEWDPDKQPCPPSSTLLGYVIIRADEFDDEDQPAVHVFESVFRKFEHFHNFVPCGKQFRVGFKDSQYSLRGVMYCQQNGYTRLLLGGSGDKKGRTKACAQVALRSLLGTRFDNRPLLFSEINGAAGVHNHPWNGLTSRQIRSVLSHYGVNYRDLDYTTNKAARNLIPYSRLLYAGLENGFGGLLGFTLAGPGAGADNRHIMPFFGHTFNQDTWAPRAQNAYFNVGDELAYIPSDEWISSYIGHDDNFGSNLCVPKRFVGADRVDYVVALLPDGINADPIQAEVAASSVLYTLFEFVPKKYASSLWHQALTQFAEQNDVVLRTHAIGKTDYYEHLTNMEDWDGNRISDLADTLIRLLPGNVESLWMVELSIPELFATNYAKLGEVIIDGEADFQTSDQMTESELLRTYLEKVVFVRLPGVILMRVSGTTEGDQASFVPVPCELTGHSPLLGVPPYSSSSM